MNENMKEVAQIICQKIRDRALYSAIGRFGRVTCHNFGDSVDPNGAEIAKLVMSSVEAEQVKGIELLIKNAVDTAIFHFLLEFDDGTELGEKIDEAARNSDGLYGEILGSEGWFAKYSKYGE